MKTYKCKVSSNKFASDEGPGIDGVIEAMIAENGLVEGQEVELAILPDGFWKELTITLQNLKSFQGRLKGDGDFWERVVEINIEELGEMTGLKYSKEEGDFVYDRA